MYFHFVYSAADPPPHTLFPLTLAPPPYVIPKNEKRDGETETDRDWQADRQTERTLSSARSLCFKQDAYLPGK